MNKCWIYFHAFSVVLCRIHAAIKGHNCKEFQRKMNTTSKVKVRWWILSVVAIWQKFSHNKEQFKLETNEGAKSAQHRSGQFNRIVYSARTLWNNYTLSSRPEGRQDIVLANNSSLMYITTTTTTTGVGSWIKANIWLVRSLIKYYP